MISSLSRLCCALVALVCLLPMVGMGQSVQEILRQLERDEASRAYSNMDGWGAIGVLIALVMGIIWCAVPFLIQKIRTILGNWDKSREEELMRLMHHERQMLEQSKLQTALLVQIRDSLDGASVETAGLPPLPMHGNG